MGAPHRWATALLRLAVRMAPEQTRAWATAMLRELDFVEGDWAALFWALGSVVAVTRHAATVWRAWFKRKAKEAVMTNTGKKVLGIAMGVLCALGLAGCAFPMMWLVPHFIPGLRDAWWPHLTVVIVFTEMMIIIAAIMLWRKRGPVAAGVMLTGLAIAFHVAVHVALH